MILGLDMATKKTGFCLMNSDGMPKYYGVLRTSSVETKDRMAEIYVAIKSIIEQNNIEHIVFEDVPVNNHNNLKTGKDLSILQGVILGLCFDKKIKYTIYNPSAWRSIVGTYDGTREGMKRNNQKRKAVEMVNELFGLDFVYNETETKSKFTDDDKAEAILIALAYIKNARRLENEV